MRYLRGWFDSYSETGSTANLSVGARTVQYFEQRGELKLTRTTTFSPSSALQLNLAGGALAVERIGGNYHQRSVD